MAKKKEEATALVKSDSAVVVERAQGIAAEALVLHVVDEKTQKQAANLLIKLKDIEKEGKAKLDFLTKPLKIHVKNITAEFAPGFEVLEAASSHLRTEFSDYVARQRDEQNRIKAESMKKAEAAAKKGKNDEAREYALAAVSAAGPARVVSASVDVAAGSSLAHAQVSMRRPWNFKVVKPADVPDEYWEIDETKLRAAVRAGVRAIPGVEIFQEDSLAVGGR